jgi:hypothetical protein
MNDFTTIINLLISPTLQELFFPLKIVFLFFSLIFLGGTTWFFFNTTLFKRIFWQDFVEILTYTPYWLRRIKGRWNKIEKRLESGREPEYKLAVLEADKMLDEALGQNGYAGANVGERVEKVSKETLSNIDDVLEAHRIRNNVVHDPDYKLTPGQARRALSFYEKALRDLDII